jgi:hypothetical protein
MEQRYYYKAKDDKGFLNLKHELTAKEINQHGYVRITKEEFERLTTPQESEESDE